MKRQLIHVGAFNLSLILRKLLGAGTPREWKNRAGQVFSQLLRFLLGLRKAVSPIWLHPPLLAHGRNRRGLATPDHHSRFFSTSATGCYAHQADPTGVRDGKLQDASERHA